jgi:hypothetical protein
LDDFLRGHCRNSVRDFQSLPAPIKAIERLDKQLLRLFLDLRLIRSRQLRKLGDNCAVNIVEDDLRHDGMARLLVHGDG